MARGRWMRRVRPSFITLSKSWRQRASAHAQGFYSENPQPNAFATGRNPSHAALCVTSGLLSRVSNEELAGGDRP